ncbi:MAG: ribosome small subunit-dependent GTPase A [Planctomycetales bacterium]|nr:ribosome small subunit-dependent GTPase A [Planctomycetales bacterium]
MAKKKRGQKIRTDFRKKHETRQRKGDLTRRYKVSEDQLEDERQSERVSGKGELTRKRTIVGDLSDDETGFGVHRDLDEGSFHNGRVLSVHGRTSVVLDEAERRWSCSTRGVLRSMSTELRHVVAAGDRVSFSVQDELASEGVIERIEPRHGVISRTSRQRQHVLVANVDLVIIVASAAEPTLKPNLIDRLLVTAEKTEIQPVVCINKVDLAPLPDLQPIAGVYGQLGYPVLLLSATTGFGVEPLRELVRGRQSVVVGQSGVGKSSLLNAIEPGLHLRVRTVSAENQKGRHTTTAAQLIPLQCGGYLVDTPGIRQFQLWDVIPAEVAGFFRDIRPFVSQCRFPDCTHIHEVDCAVKDAVADCLIDERRYESYMHMFTGDMV